MKHRLPLILIIGLSLFLACSLVQPMPAALATSGDARLPARELRGTRCFADSTFDCTTLEVPLDHFGNPDGETIKVTFAVHQATGRRKGMLMIVVGGPGGSGIAETNTRAEEWPETLTESFDLVMFDPRGVGRSGNLDCQQADGDFDSSPDMLTPRQEADYAAAARAFAEDCVNEMNVADPSTLAFYGTRQVAEDIEAFRNKVGEKKLWMYGESYGTQVTQWYAVAHPDRVAGMVLDGVVDLQRTAEDFLRERSTHYQQLLEAVSAACVKDHGCNKDAAGKNLMKGYADLVKSLTDKPLSVKFRNGSGRLISREVTLDDLDSVTTDLLESERGRMRLQRMLVGVSRGDMSWLGRSLGYSTHRRQAVQPEDSDGMYYAVECMDYPFFSGDPDARAAAYTRAGDDIDRTVYMSRYFYQDLACAYWPGVGSGYVKFDPAPARAIPTLIVAAAGDVLTPPANADRVLTQYEQSSMIVYSGGEHVMFNQGSACVDNAVVAFFVDGERPVDRTTRCGTLLNSAYIPLPLAAAAQIGSPLEGMRTFEDQLLAMPEYADWQDGSSLTIGCTWGGTLTYTDKTDRLAVAMDRCAMTEGFALTGSGSLDMLNDTAKLSVTVKGAKSGKLSYTRAQKTARVTGVYDGTKIK